ncbi:MAG TPA: dienelactone hydrolase family protein [Planctomycetota bacterium]|nr:dienelactone hydrolase family protein [Planctomycetota bacterium]
MPFHARSFRLSLAVLLATLLSASAFGAAEFEARIFKDAGGATLPYRLLRPKNYDPKQVYPLVLFLHGSGERGNDNQRQLVHGTKLFLKEENLTKYPCFVVAPQCPSGKQWVDTPWGNDSHVMPEKPSEPMRLALELIEELKTELRINEKRLYVTGLSMGGFGAWDAIQRNPNMFAAAIPVCGGADETKAALIAKIPVWVWHGDKDTVVKTKRSRNIVDALKKAGGDPKYNELKDTGHDAWTKAYSEPTLLEWLFKQSK